MKKITAVILTLVMLLSFAGCKDKEESKAPPEDFAVAEKVVNETLEDYVENDKELKTMIDDIAESSGMLIEVEDNMMTFIYAYDQVLDDATVQAMIPEFESTMENFSSTFNQYADAIESQTGLDEVTLRVVYQNGDGSEIYSKDY